MKNQKGNIGRPKTNPLPLKEQVRLNVRNFRNRLKDRGYSRVELTIPTEIIQEWKAEAKARKVCLSELATSFVVKSKRGARKRA